MNEVQVLECEDFNPKNIRDSKDDIKVAQSMLLAQGSTNDFTKSGFQNNQPLYDQKSKHTKVNSMVNQKTFESESDFKINLHSVKNKQS